MNKVNGKALLGKAIAGLGIVFMAAPSAHAGTLHNGWHYAIDSFTDGVTGGVIGADGAFEFYSLALREETEHIFVAINTNLLLSGYEDSTATNGSIAYGDLFFNFSSNDFKTASTKEELFAIRFSVVNDSGVNEVGVYSNVTAKNVSQYNVGFSNLEEYNTYVIPTGGIPTLGDLTSQDPYLEQTGEWTILNAIASGRKVGDINFVDNTTLTSLGLDFNYFNAVGSQTIGFKFAKDLLPSGNFIAHILAECANDGIALKGELQVKEAKNVPEPSSVGASILFGLAMLAFNRKKIPH
ncbi:MAG TPA: PEP-CTERM sorting domain-containing protein [Cyanobacteria bacterium UBA8803]|nr:PEP-CTERM sorting domain-containing protein [Cyanobacteria bacterium UBA9273]HBL58136.1 PEP-CTERM sorting domain-containing protein [Cyanobacteria bacterium UBA8803]